MRECRVILAVLGLLLVAIAILALFALGQHKWGHSRFLSKDQAYYSRVADACDSLLKAKTIAPEGYVAMSGSEKSIPKIIRELSPSKIIISKTGVTILVGQGRPDFGITWKQDVLLGTNQWTLSAGTEGSSKTVYRSAF